MMRSTVFYAGVLVSLPLSSTAAPSPVVVAHVEHRSIVPTLPVSGTVLSKNEQQITAGIDGQILSVAEPGAKVQRGQILARLDATPLTLMLSEQEAQVVRARARLRFVDAQLARQTQLRTENHVTDFDVEQAQLDRSVAASDLRIAQARVRQTQDRLKRATVRAQFDGVVVARERRAGEDVTRGTTLGRFADLNTLEVRALVPAKYGARRAPEGGLNVFGFESRFEGRVRAAIPSVNPRSQTVELRVDLPTEARSVWTVGQLVTVAVPLRQAPRKTDALAVPRDALVLRQEGAYVFRIGVDNMAERVAVKVGDGEREWVAVTGALNVGDRVAIRGAETLKDGQQVDVLGPSGGEKRAL